MLETGTIKWFNARRRFGFIKPEKDDGKGDVKFSLMVCTRDVHLYRQIPVKFERGVNEKNGEWIACRVRPLNTTEA